MEVSPEIYTVIVAGIGGTVFGALCYPLLTKYNLLPTQKVDENKLEKLVSTENRLK